MYLRFIFEKYTHSQKRLSHLIQKYEIPSQYLVFEITESTYIHNIEAVNHMIRFFHEKNIRISMDDFGSGYSSLNTLKDILFDEVKIDKKFLSDRLTENGKIVLQEIFHLLKKD
ncbi:MAG: EAL domain-containing protein [Ruminococcus sp.]